MTQVTPPGWYPDPGQTSDGPATERWWDGKAWTEQTRPAGSAADWGPPPQPPAGGAPPAEGAYPTYPADGAYPAYPADGAYPAYPGYPGYPAPPATGRRGLRTGVAVGIAVAVLAAIGVGAWALTGSGGDSGGQQASQQGSGGQGGFGQGGPEGQSGGQSGGQGLPFGGSGSGGTDGGASPSPGQSEAPKVKGGGTVSDSINAISIPVPEGWTGQAFTYGAQVTSDDSYKCPGDTSKSCTAGGAYSEPAVVLGTKGDTAEEVAKADISANAEESYGGKTYGSITSHQVLASKAVTVAGQKGYMVRWKAITSKGADGYVESLAFPSPSNSAQIVVVRFGVDVGQKESVIDTITSGIKVSSGSGSGSNV
ncbi:DUF2510 domain-containing protein [Streptomyces fuscichromogenes]|uniref:Membrane protein n=1 Tax=Streptomyces fuscichromogenes TaxID=1324013 RepID=A0A918CTP8_9ACTN|nr:DUF2510 domain-containing protein [Streptomyces fuscichromogenes]GGN23824.1 membrane protein [Streptomyces fuscichromogenes]